MESIGLYKELVGHLLPEGILEYFELTHLQKDGEYLNIYLTEKDSIPIEYSKERYRSNGFLPEKEVKDFPIRQQLVTLYVKQRRWLLLDNGQKVRRDWPLVAKGTRLTPDLAAFLKVLT